MDYKSEILNRYTKEIRDKTLSSEKTVEFFIKNPLYLQRTLCNPFAVAIYSFILSRCLSNINKNYDIDGYVYVTVKDIANNLHYSNGVISKIISKLVRCELLYVDKKTTKRGIYNYYKINQVMLDILCLEDTAAWHFCTTNQIEPSKEELDSRCPMKVVVREMFDTENPDFYKVVERITNFENLEKYLGGVFTLCTRGGFHVMHKGFSRYDQGVFTLCIPTIDKYTKEKITTDKAFSKLNAQIQPEVANAPSSGFEPGVYSEDKVQEEEEENTNLEVLAEIEENSSSCNIPKEETKNIDSLEETNEVEVEFLAETNKNNNNESYPRSNNKNICAAAENSNSVNGGYKATTDVSQNSDWDDTKGVRNDSNSKDDLWVQKDPKMRNQGKKTIDNQQSIFFSNDSGGLKNDKLTKKSKKQLQLEAHREKNPEFMRVYDAWVEQGFPAHGPDTATFKKALADFNKVRTGEFYKKIVDLDQYAKPYGPRAIIKAIKNFKLAFDINYEPVNKKWLESRKSLGKFFYDPSLFSKSLFLEFLEEPKLVAPMEKSVESKYKDKYGVDYCYMPEWFVPLYEEAEENGVALDDTKAPQGLDGYAFFFYYLLDKENYYMDGCLFKDLKFGWSDFVMFVEKWLAYFEYEKDIDENDGRDLTQYDKALDALVQIKDKVLSMGEDSVCTRGHLFSDKVWDLVFEK